jgi:hypothetical protein
MIRNRILLVLAAALVVGVADGLPHIRLLA